MDYGKGDSNSRKKTDEIDSDLEPHSSDSDEFIDLNVHTEYGGFREVISKSGS